MDSINDILENLSGEDISRLKDMAKDIFGGTEDEEEAGAFADFDFKQIKTILSTVRGDDDKTRLIKAIKPLLSAERRKRADEALRLLKLFRMLPLIQNSGILNGLFEEE